jgi:signal peptidase
MDSSKKRFKHIKAVFSIITLIMFIAVLALAISLAVKYSRGDNIELFGHRLYFILTGSMEPKLNPGDVIISRGFRDGMDIKVGDTVTFVGETGAQEGKIITHKVIRAPFYDNGVIKLQTQGINNLLPDDPILLSSVTAVMVRKSSVFTFFFNLLSKPYGFVLIAGLPITAFIAGQTVRIVKNKRNKEADANESVDADKDTNGDANVEKSD